MKQKIVIYQSRSKNHHAQGVCQEQQYCQQKLLMKTLDCAQVGFRKLRCIFKKNTLNDQQNEVSSPVSRKIHQMTSRTKLVVPVQIKKKSDGKMTLSSCLILFQMISITEKIAQGCSTGKLDVHSQDRTFCFSIKIT